MPGKHKRQPDEKQARESKPNFRCCALSLCLYLLHSTTSAVSRPFEKREDKMEEMHTNNSDIYVACPQCLKHACTAACLALHCLRQGCGGDGRIDRLAMLTSIQAPPTAAPPLDAATPAPDHIDNQPNGNDDMMHDEPGDKNTGRRGVHIHDILLFL